MLTLTLLASLLTAQPTFAAPSTTNTAYVNMARALNEVHDGKTAKAKLRKNFDTKQKQLDSEQKRLKNKKDDFEKRVATMRPEVRAQKGQELQQELVQLQQTYVQMQRDLMEEESRLTNEIGSKLKTIIGKIGDREEYSMILNLSGETVLYSKRHRDITDSVVKMYNKQFGKK